jgi:hypothetical protein
MPAPMMARARLRRTADGPPCMLFGSWVVGRGERGSGERERSKVLEAVYGLGRVTIQSSYRSDRKAGAVLIGGPFFSSVIKVQVSIANLIATYDCHDLDCPGGVG